MRTSGRMDCLREAQLVYLAKDELSGLYKIGLSKNPRKRMMAFDCCNCKMCLILTYRPKNSLAIYLERDLHDKFKDSRIKGEWFDLTEKDVEYIKNLDL